MKKVMLIICAALAIGITTTSCNKAKECDCRLVWTNPNYTVSASQNVVWPVNAGETCSEAEWDLNNEYTRYSCTKK